LQFLLSSCNTTNLENSKPIFTLLDSSQSGFFCWNEVKETEELNANKYGYLYNGSGVAIGDINNDGLPDIYMGGNLFGGRLFLNLGKMKFKQISETSNTFSFGYSTGVTMADVNQDGYLDIYVSRSLDYVDSNRENRLFINNKNNTFTERAKEFGINDAGYTTQSNFFDYDNDGDLDLYVLNHKINFNETFLIMPNNQREKNIQQKSNDEYQKFASKLYRNNGNNSFTDVTKSVGLLDEFWGLSATVGDFNHDGFMDLYCTSDFAEKDHLYINNGNGTFSDKIDASIGHISKNSMGSDIADINNDGFLDIMTLDMMAEDNYRNKQLKGNSPYDLFHMAKNYGYHCQVMRNCLQLNNGNGTFSEIAQLSGISHTDWSWAPLFADYDNDGKKDLFITNGYARDMTDMDYLKYTSSDIVRNAGGLPYVKSMDLLNAIKSTPTQNYLYQNKGNLVFENKNDSWGMKELSFSNGAAYADLDLDGDLDMLVNNYNSPAFLYENNTRQLYPENTFLTFNFKPEELHSVQGTTIKIFTDSGIQFQQLISNRGFMSSVEPILHFGFGLNNKVQKIEITFPNKKIIQLNQPKLNSRILLEMNKAYAGVFENELVKAEIKFEEIEDAILGNEVHQESPFIDFKDEPLLEQMYSNRGPFIAVGDVNKDGLDDFYEGGSAGFSGKLFIQNQQQKWVLKPTPDFEKDKLFEDGESIFFDADGDKDLDLYVTSGSNEVRDENLYIDRLYINDGLGNFTKNINAIPAIKSNTQSVVSIDIDGDVDLDLIVGGNVKPKNFPNSFSTYVLINNKGIFSKNEKVLPNTGNFGIVNDIEVLDINNDKKMDIVLAGDWMPILVLVNQGNKFIDESKKYGFDKTEGMWNCIYTNDVNNDGKQDLLFGNRGSNNFFKVSEKYPAVLYAADFDENEEVDALVNYHFKDNILYPKYSLDELLEQIPAWRGIFTRYENYSKTKSDEMFSKSKYPNMLSKKCYTFESCLYIQNNKNEFVKTELPIETQFSPLQSFASFNNKGNQFFVGVGNNYGVDVNTGQYDASFGNVFYWSSKKLEIVPNYTIDFQSIGDTRKAKVLKINNNQQVLLISSNNYKLQVLKIN
jgi:hypothetical protein